MAKINKKQLEELQKISSFITDLQTEIARNTINNHKLAHAYSQQEVKLNELKKELQEKYGNITVDVKTGEIEKQQNNEQANKKN
tara:strand:+ start:2874 stop:3125 length:252 start_codon:yes stop_codon:yes gene_type:complete